TDTGYEVLTQSAGTPPPPSIVLPAAIAVPA
ncbi:MAG TPA: type I methionyl aminopeptidase, partial [Massilia sp.]|nr:type I methionyl aminopeptidase [Massilia sp.]